jgi:CDP-diacylglycerol pyrophosphatase
MIPGLFHITKQEKLIGRYTIFSALAVAATTCACVFFLFLPAGEAQTELSSNALWEVVHNICVPGQAQHHDPRPCIRVDLKGGTENGFAILRDPRGGTQFLLIPTTRISGIESPIVRGPNAPNYFADAWKVRTYIDEALHQTLPQDGIGLAINSAAGRSQNQLHIHFSCVRAETLEALHKNEEKIGDHWSRLNVSLSGHNYMAMWVQGNDLSLHNPFRLLAERLPDATRNMGSYTIVVIGLTRADGTKGFVILTNQVKKGDPANGEELLDHTCRIVAMGK